MRRRSAAPSCPGQDKIAVCLLIASLSVSYNKVRDLQLLEVALKVRHPPSTSPGDMFKRWILVGGPRYGPFWDDCSLPAYAEAKTLPVGDDGELTRQQPMTQRLACPPCKHEGISTSHVKASDWRKQPSPMTRVPTFDTVQRISGGPG
jgi:hypothetical protein